MRYYLWRVHERAGPRGSLCCFSTAKRLAERFLQTGGHSLPSMARLSCAECRVDAFCEYAGDVWRSPASNGKLPVAFRRASVEGSV